MAKTDPLDPAHSDLLLVFTGKATMNDFFVNVLDNQPLAVDPFTKYSTHGLDSGFDHALTTLVCTCGSRASALEGSASWFGLWF